MALGNHPQYKPFARAVRRNEVEAMRALRPAFQATEASLTALSFRALGWAAQAGALFAFRELLRPEWAAINPAAVNSVQGGLLGELIQSTEPGSMAESVFPALVKALVEAGVPLQSPQYVTQPLANAMFRHQLPVVKALLEAGADPDGLFRWKEGATSAHGTPPLCSAQTLEMVDVLLKHGASPGAAPAGMSLGVFGGVYSVLHKWKNASELGALWDVMRNNGVTLETPVEDGAFGEAVPFATAVFERVPDARIGQGKSAWADSFRKTYEFHLQKRALIQEMLVGRGFDLNGIASDGRAWGEHVVENGSSVLRRQFQLEQSLPAPARVSRGPRF